MSKLENAYNSLATHQPNRAAVANRMLQLFAAQFVPEIKYMIPTLAQVLHVICQRESVLLGRDTVREGESLAKQFWQALRESTDHEWEEFQKEHDTGSLSAPELNRLIADGSGLVRSEGFDEWVLEQFSGKHPEQPGTAHNNKESM